MLNVLNNGGCFGDVWEGSGGGCNGTRVAVDDFELREGMKKRFIGRLVVLVSLVLVFVLARLVFLLDTRRCSLRERGITTVEDDNPNLENRGVTS